MVKKDPPRVEPEVAGDARAVAARRLPRAYSAAVNSTPDSPGIRYRRDGPIARIVLKRPDRHNALGADDVATLKGALDQVVDDDAIRAVVLTGAGDRTFCSGAALEEMESGRMSGAVFDTLTDRLASLSLPTVARINGSVYGGGAELALCCDFRVGVEGMRLSVPAAKLGVCYPPGGLRRYATRLGLGTASRILLSAEELGADELLRTGYLTHLAPPENLDTEVDDLASRLAALAPLAVKNMKRALLAIVTGDRDEAILDRLVEECANSDDLKEGLLAWREGRPPDFRGS